MALNVFQRRSSNLLAWK